MVPALSLVTLAIWERRFRELWRWELYVGLGLQAAIILPWVWFVYAGPDGPDHLKVFFWNNLVGRFTHIDAPQELRYAAAHRNSPGKYLVELPMYLWPWTLLVIAAARRAWQRRHAPLDEYRAVRFALASTLPPLAVLSFAATARNIYLAPALPGFALLVAWWTREVRGGADRWDVRAVRGTAVLLLLAVLAFGAALSAVGLDAWDRMSSRAGFILISGLGLLAAAALALKAGKEARAGRMQRGLGALLFAYCVLLAAPASQLYRQVDAWQNLASVGRAIEADSAGRPLILFAPDETTRALIDLYSRTSVGIVQGPIDSVSIERLRQHMAREPRAFAVVQLHGRSLSPALQRIADEFGLTIDAVRDSAGAPAWILAAQLRIAHLYALPNGRRYALLESVR
jgi:4-amino-4-deoxy-L-arabinose transferase-like glycosyltransferase